MSGTVFKRTRQFTRKNDLTFCNFVTGREGLGFDAAHLLAHLDRAGHEPETADESPHRSAEEHQGFLSSYLISKIQVFTGTVA